MLNRELYNQIVVGAGATIKHSGPCIGGFICTVTGTVTITEEADPDGVVRAVLTAFPVTQGNIYMWRLIGGSRPFTLAFTTAAGTLLV